MTIPVILTAWFLTSILLAIPAGRIIAWGGA